MVTTAAAEPSKNIVLILADDRMASKENTPLANLWTTMLQDIEVPIASPTPMALQARSWPDTAGRSRP